MESRTVQKPAVPCNRVEVDSGGKDCSGSSEARAEVLPNPHGGISRSTGQPSAALTLHAKEGILFILEFIEGICV